MALSKKDVALLGEMFDSKLEPITDRLDSLEDSEDGVTVIAPKATKGASKPDTVKKTAARKNPTGTPYYFPTKQMLRQGWTDVSKGDLLAYVKQGRKKGTLHLQCVKVTDSGIGCKKAPK